MRTSQSVVSTFVEQYEPHAYQGNVFYDLIYEIAKKCKDCGGGEETSWNVETVNTPTQHVNTYFGVSNSDSLDSSSLAITLLNTTTPKFVSTLGVDIVIRKEDDGVMFSGTLKKASDGTVISTTDIQEWEEKYKNYLHMSPEAHRYYIVVNDSISSPLTISSTSDDSTLLYLSAMVIVNANLSKLEFRADDILKINLSTTQAVKMAVDTTYTYSYQSTTSTASTASLLSAPLVPVAIDDGWRLVSFRGDIKSYRCENMRFYADFGFDSIPLSHMLKYTHSGRIELYGSKLMNLSGQEKLEAKLRVEIIDPVDDETYFELINPQVMIE